MNISDLVFIDATGFHYADFPTFLSYYKSQYQAIYGADVYLEADSQDGQFVSLLAQAAYDTAVLAASTYSSFSPVTAQGVGLSRNVKINGIERQAPTHSTVQLVIVGVANTFLTNAIATDSLNQQWSIPDCTIPGGGTITVTATAVEEGALSAVANTITNIFTPTLGWQTVNNPAPATPGVGVQSDASLRAEQIDSVSLPSLTVFDGTIGAVRNVSGVQTAVGYENATDVTDGNGLPPHSVAVVAFGGNQDDIAQAIQIHKTPGTQTFGTTTVNVQDSHGMPLAINFFFATQAAINVQVTITELDSFASSTIALIQKAVSDYITNNSNIPIGGDVVITQLIVAAYLVGTPQFGTFNINSIEIAKNSLTYAASDIQLLFNEIAVTPTSGVVVVT